MSTEPTTQLPASPPLVRDRLVWIGPRHLKLRWPADGMMTKAEAVAEAAKWPREKWSVQIRTVPNDKCSHGADNPKA